MDRAFHSPPLSGAIGGVPRRPGLLGPHITGRPGEIDLVQTVVLKPSDVPEDFVAP
jgi:hypothetical protein